uniref:Uncharacterized protein n=1 Tax=Aegilops tauschii subsp. strangulata TaxID=200361 RepID=A0A453SER1_AEGTS
MSATLIISTLIYVVVPICIFWGPQPMKITVAERSILPNQGYDIVKFLLTHICMG